MMRQLAICVVAVLAAAGQVLAQSAPPTKAPALASRAAANHANDQFTSEQTAVSHCPGDTIVWVNRGSSRAYHLSSDRYYGKTKRGAYMCRQDADKSGFHLASRRAGKSATQGTTPKTSN